MQIRNPTFNVRGGIDLEINHAAFGWIPFTANRDDPETFGSDIYEAAIAGGNVGPYVPPVEPARSTDPRDHLLTPTQWRYMVRAAGLWDNIDTVKAYLKESDLVAWAGLMEALEGHVFDFDATLAQIASFAPLLTGVTLPDDAALTPLWLDAAAR